MTPQEIRIKIEELDLQINRISLKNVFIKFIINSKEDTVLLNSFVFNHSSLIKNKIEYKYVRVKT